MFIDDRTADKVYEPDSLKEIGYYEVVGRTFTAEFKKQMVQLYQNGKKKRAIID